MKFKHQQSGLTVVELMVALLLSLLLMGAVLQIYLGTKTTYTVTEGLSRLQENTRFASDLLARDIRMAGYIPCGRPQNAQNLVNSNQWWASLFENSIRGYENGVSPFPATSGINVAPGSDAIVILRGGNHVAAVKSYDSVNNEIVMQRNLDTTNWAQPGSLMIACDATDARLFQAGSIVSGNPTRIKVAGSGSDVPGNTSSNLGHSFDHTAQLSDYNAVAYYIRESSSAEGYSLYRRYLNVNSSGENKPISEELVEGIETMQLEYGLDVNDDGVADRYLQANHALLLGRWQDVVSVRIGLLFASEEGMRNPGDFDEEVYLVGTTEVGVAGDASEAPTHQRDRRKRYVSSLTISIRNS